MGHFKDLYIAELEAEMNRLEEQGIPAERAYSIAGDKAYSLVREKMAHWIDLARDNAKGKPMNEEEGDKYAADFEKEMK